MARREGEAVEPGPVLEGLPRGLDAASTDGGPGGRQQLRDRAQVALDGAAARLPSPMARMTVARAADDVAAGEDAGHAGHAVLVDDDVAPLVELEVRRGRGEQRVGPRADGHDDHVAVDVELAARDGHRAAPAGRVRLAQLHLWHSHARSPSPSRRRGSRTGAARISKLMPSSSAWWTSSRAGRHLVLAAAVDDDGLVGAQALGRAHGVHGHVAAADDDHALAPQRRACRSSVRKAPIRLTRVRYSLAE